MVKEGIELGHKVSGTGLEVNKAKINVISKLPPPTNIKDTPFEFNDECRKAFKLLKEKLTCALVIESLNWNLPFELMCDESDFAIGFVLVAEVPSASALQVLRRLGSIFTLVYAAIQKLKKNSFWSFSSAWLTIQS
ncbi:reverse transcriptase domain-containing protein [Tanacetum coccineum]